MADFDPQNPFARESENTDPRRSALFASSHKHNNVSSSSSNQKRDLKKDSRPIISARRELRLKHSKIRRNVLIGISIFIGLLLALIATDTIKLGTGQQPYFSKDSQSFPEIKSNPVKVEGQQIEALRELTPGNPLRVYIGGDSLVGSFGNDLGNFLGQTGVAKATWDSRPSSGLVNENFFNWPKHLKDMMSKYNPEIVLFMIGTNDASIVSSNPTNYDEAYTSKLNKIIDIANTDERKVVFVLAPAMKDNKLDSNLKKLNKVIKNVASDNGVYIIDSNNVLSPKFVFQKSLLLSNKNIVVRADDGVHISGIGGELLGQYIYSVLDKTFFIERFSDGKAIKPTKVPGCCTSYKNAPSIFDTTTTTSAQKSESTTSPNSTSTSTSSTTQTTAQNAPSE